MLHLENECLRVLLGTHPNAWQEEAAAKWDKLLTEANATLAKADINWSLEAITTAWTTKHSIEWMCEQAERKQAEAVAESERKQTEDAERERAWQVRLATEPVLRREVERREREMAQARKHGWAVPKFGPLPSPPTGDEHG